MSFNSSDSGNEASENIKYRLQIVKPKKKNVDKVTVSTKMAKALGFPTCKFVTVSTRNGQTPDLTEMVEDHSLGENQIALGKRTRLLLGVKKGESELLNFMPY